MVMTRPLTLFALFSLSLGTLVVSHEQDVLVPVVGLDLDEPVRTSDSWGYTDCGLPTDLVQIYSLVVSPDPPQPGKNMTVNVKGLVKQEIQDGAYADVTVKLGLIKLLQRQFDICKEARGANATVQCPVGKDEYEIEQTVALPKEIPKAKFNVHTEAYTVDDEPLFCLDITVNFMKPFKMPQWTKIGA